MKREIIWTLQNDWVQFGGGGWNWVTFRFLQCEVERDYQFDGWILTVVVFGVGFHVRFNTGKETEESLDIEKHLEEIKNGTAKFEPVDFKELWGKK